MNDSEFSKKPEGTSYRDSGVDLDKYQQAMSRLPQWMRRTFTPRVLPWDGGFAGLFRLDGRTRLFSRGYRDPVLVSGTDGVGTKLRVAQLEGRHDSIGIDLVAMCVNDVICCGAEPLFFLDYIAMAQDDPERLEQIVAGISDGCLQSEMALLGGETAIMPDTYREGDYDLAGFAVGIVEKRNLIDGRTIHPDDVVIGLHSNGLHSNGYSLVRKVVFDIAGLDCSTPIPEWGETVGQALLQPTRIYAAAIKKILRHYRVKNVIHGIAHITGGGLCENLGRVLPDHCDIALDRATWQPPAIFPWLQQLGNISDDEMDRVFNMGIGMALVVSPYYTESIQRMLSAQGYGNTVIGRVDKGEGRVRLK